MADRTPSAYARLLAESEQLVRALSGDDWEGFEACLDRRQSVVDGLHAGGERNPGDRDLAEETVLIRHILAVERVVTDLVRARMTTISAAAADQRHALEAYADRSDASTG
ncbi:MAG: flagellar protein FliT [Nitrospirota bacterium]